MTVLIVLLGSAILVLGLLGVLMPKRLLQLTDVLWNGEQSLYIAAAVRFGIGVLLVVAAPATRWPSLVTALGIIAFAAAFVLLFAGFKRVDAVIRFWQRMPPVVVRLGCLAVVAIGGVLIFAGS